MLLTLHLHSNRFERELDEMDILGEQGGSNYYPQGENEGKAINLAFLAFVILNLVTWFWMVMIQYFIFRVLYTNPNRPSRHRGHHVSSRSSNTTPIKAPSTGETYLLVGLLWIIHGVIDTILASMMDMMVWTFSDCETMATYLEWRGSLYNMRYWAGGVESGIGRIVALLGVELIATWLLSQSFLFICDTLIPVLSELRQDHHMVLMRIHRRVWELDQYFRMMNWTNESERVVKMEDEDPNGIQEQIVPLSRQRTESLKNGDHERKLDWRLVIDKGALNEMKEMLGPAGGFGELGFSVAKDRVCLGAVSRGSSFILTFRLDEKGEEIGGRR